MSRSAAFLVSLAMLVACGGSAPLPDTDEARLGYALGQRIGRDLTEQGATADLEALRKGLQDGLAGRDSTVDLERSRSLLGTLKKEIVADHPDEAFAGRRRRPEEAPFLAANAGREGVTVLESGVQVEILEEGDGRSPTMEDEVRIRYRSNLPNGQVIWDSLDEEPEVHAMERLPRGFAEGLTHLPGGGRAYVVVPSNLAYTNFKMGPFSRRAIAFEVELVGIVDRSAE